MAAKKTKQIAKRAAIQTAETEAVVAKVATLKPAGVSQSISSLREKIEDLSDRMSDGVRTLEEINIAIASREGRLKELFQIENELLDLDTLKAERLTAQEEYAAEQDARDEERTREEAEYQYALTRKRRDEVDKYNDAFAAQKKVQERSLNTLQQEMNERLEDLEAKEEEIEELRTKVAEFPDLLKAAEGKARGMTEATLKRDHEHELKLLQKDADAAAKLASQAIESLKNELFNAQSRAEDLNAALVEERTRTQAIAEKYAETMSGNQALNALQASLANQGSSTKNGR